jgi:hypothetical protein
MVAFYFDTSAIVKRYDLRETGSPWIRSLFSSSESHLYLFSQIVIVELTSAFYRKHREGTFDDHELQVALDMFNQHNLQDYWLEPVRESIIKSAARLIARHPLRTYDAVQLATALEAQADLQPSGVTILFLSADDRLLQAARGEGLLTDNPNLH